MSDDNANKKPARPNANYRLSHEKADPEEIVYHYNREQRLAKAPQAVRDLYKEDARPRRFGLFRSLVDTKPKVMTFASIIVACLAIWAISIFGLMDTHTLERNQLTVQAIKYEGAVIISIKKSVPKTLLNRIADPYTGAVDIAVSPTLKAGEEQGYGPKDIVPHRIFFTHESPEFYKFSVPFDSNELTIVFQTEKKSLGITVKPE